MRYIGVLVSLTLVGCSGVTTITVQRGQLDSVAVQRLNRLLAEAEVEVELRGGVPQPPSLQNRVRCAVTATHLLAVGRSDTVAVPIEYVARIRGSHPRASARLVVGGVAGCAMGTVAGLLLSSAAPLPLSIGGAAIGLAVAALLSQPVVVDFDHTAREPGSAR